jgi:translation initiation factor IF-2
MAKIRVYELARDLNLTNKELIDKLAEFGYSVGNHMSSLEDDVLSGFRARLRQKPIEGVQETRIRPTVIRRRKKADEQSVNLVETAGHEYEAVDAPLETGITEIQDESEFEPEPNLPRSKPLTEIPTSDEPLSGKEVENEVLPEAQAPPTPMETKVDEPAGTPVETEITAKVIAEETLEAPPESYVREKAPETLKSAPTESDQLDAVTLKKIKPDAKKRRGQKDMPAKIIKLGPAPAPPPPEKEKPVEIPAKAVVDEKPDKPALPIPVPGKKEKTTVIIQPADKTAQKEKDKKKKGGKIRTAPVEDAEPLLKKKTSFRKKAVVEGHELYAKQNRPRKLRKGEKGKLPPKGQVTQITTPKAIKRRIKIDDTIVLADLAKRMGVKAAEIIKNLMGMGVLATVNQTIDYETAVLLAAEFDYEIERASFEEETILRTITDDPEKRLLRPPVVTVMGHVDHGKTSLLDAIRKTSVTEQEAGGITQHIGAYSVNTDRGQIVFLDTPGHEAFTAMRSRGASITDLVILVVAADDGVMPQTIEAINHAKAANVPMIVAVNKIDKPNAQPDRVRRELADVGLTPEEWGGDAIFINISAKQHIGLEDLLEMVAIQAEVMELKANPNKLASGHVIEAKLDIGRGPVATVLVQDGTLRAGDAIVCGLHYGKIRALTDDKGNPVQSAGPSMPVEIVGITGVPNAGDEFVALEDEKSAKQVSMNRMQKQRSKELAKTNRLSLENLFEQMKEREIKDLNILIKADVHGSIEALKDSLIKLSNEEVKINIIHSATGAIAESDVSLAAVSEAIIIGFNVRPNAKVQSLAAEENVNIRYYDVIYNVISDVQKAILGMMASTFEERILGTAEVRDLFHVPKIGVIAGCHVTDGKIQRGQKARLIRDGIVIYDGKIGSLRRFKDDVKEVLTGFECGIGIENFNDIKIGDVIECYYMEEIRPEF